MNTRRSLVLALGAASLTAPLGSLAQPQVRVWRVGFLSARRRPASLDSDSYGAFARRMGELGYVENRNLMTVIEPGNRVQLDTLGNMLVEVY